MLLIGIFVLAVGVSDFVIAAVLSRTHATTGSGLGPGAQPPPAARILRRTGAVTVLVGAVLVVIGLLA